MLSYLIDPFQMRVCTDNSNAFLSCCSTCRTRTFSCRKTYVPHYTTFGGSNKLSVKLMQNCANLCVLGLQNTWQSILSLFLHVSEEFSFYKNWSNLSSNVGELDFLDKRLLPTAHCSRKEIALFTNYLMKVLAKRSTQTGFVSHRLPHTWQNRKVRTAVFVTTWVVVHVERRLVSHKEHWIVSEQLRRRFRREIS